MICREICQIPRERNRAGKEQRHLRSEARVHGADRSLARTDDTTRLRRADPADMGAREPVWAVRP